MRMPSFSWWIVLVAAATGCSSDEPGEATGDTSPTADTAPIVKPYVPKSLCGDTTFHDITVRGIVNNAAGAPAANVSVELEDRSRQPADIIGSDTTDGAGQFTFPVSQLRSVEDCWGNGVLDYRLVGTLGTATFEQGINQPIFNAIFLDKDNDVDLSAIPFELSE